MSLTLTAVSKRYGRNVALHPIDLRLESGVIALIGANGSGKSTLLRLLTTLDQPDTGVIQWRGITYSAQLDALRQQIGYLPQKLALPTHLTAYHLLHYLAQMRQTSTTAADAIIRDLALDAISHQPLGKLSSGQLRRVGIAQAFLARPNLLLLDEPTTGLDVLERQRLYRLIAQPRHLTLFSTHFHEEAAAIADRVIVLNAGHVVRG